ncbi:protein GOS9-like [Rutidosis leptorrhynchoides]|uniref:protein GOS9-like n=1 Tax=Rutidosis leptorrhynchoides TaxID=125765 RepID=UPI003A997FDE
MASAGNIVKVGPWGDINGGVNPWSFVPASGSKITGIIVTSTDKCIYALTFIYKTADRISHVSQKFGAQSGGGTDKKVTFAEGEYITGISGTVGVYNGYKVITSLTFHGSKKDYGPYGSKSGGTAFSLPVRLGDFVGFYGNYGAYLDNLGVYLSPPSFLNTSFLSKARS